MATLASTEAKICIRSCALASGFPFGCKVLCYSACTDWSTSRSLPAYYSRGILYILLCVTSVTMNEKQTKRIVRITAVGLLGLERINSKQKNDDDNGQQENKPSTITLSSRLRQQQQQQQQHGTKKKKQNETPNRLNKSKIIGGKKKKGGGGGSNTNTNSNTTSNMTSTSCPSKPLSMYRYHKQDMLGTSWIQSRLTVGVSRTSIMFIEADCYGQQQQQHDVVDEDDGKKMKENSIIEVEVECLVDNVPVGVAVCTIASSDEAYANEGARVLDLPIIETAAACSARASACAAATSAVSSSATTTSPSPSRRLARMFKSGSSNNNSSSKTNNAASLLQYRVSKDAFLRVMVEFYTPGSKVERQWFERIAKVSDLQENHWNLLDEDEYDDEYGYDDDMTSAGTGSGTYTYDDSSTRYTKNNNRSNSNNNSVQSFDYTFETTAKFESGSDGGSTMMGDHHTLASTVQSRYEYSQYSRGHHSLPSIVQTMSHSTNDNDTDGDGGSLNSGTIATVGTLTLTTNAKKSAAEKAVDFSCMPCRMVNKKQTLYFSDSIDEDEDKYDDQSTIATNINHNINTKGGGTTTIISNSRSLFDADDDNGGDADVALAAAVQGGPSNTRDRMGLNMNVNITTSGSPSAGGATPLRSNKQDSSSDPNNDDSGTYVTYTLDSSSEYGDAFERRNRLSRSSVVVNNSNNQSASAPKTSNHRGTSMPMNILSLFQCVGNGSESLVDQYEVAGCANNCTADVSAKNKSVPLILEDLTIDEDGSGILETSII